MAQKNEKRQWPIHHQQLGLGSNKVIKQTPECWKSGTFLSKSTNGKQQQLLNVLCYTLIISPFIYRTVEFRSEYCWRWTGKAGKQQVSKSRAVQVQLNNILCLHPGLVGIYLSVRQQQQFHVYRCCFDAAVNLNGKWTSRPLFSCSRRFTHCWMFIKWLWSIILYALFTHRKSLRFWDLRLWWEVKNTNFNISVENIFVEIGLLSRFFAEFLFSGL